MRTIRNLAACLLVATNAWAIIPENGWWWASNESGRGFNLEVQNNLLFFATFAYDSSGNPIWMTSGGPMTSDRNYTGDLFRFSSGQCFGCPYRAPTVINAGTLTLQFTSSQTAVLTINGVSVSVKRFDFWLNETAPDAMLGEFSYVIGSASDQPYDGERVIFNAKRSDSNGLFLSGNRLGSSASAAVVAYYPTAGAWQVLLDSSTTYYRLFRFNTTGFNRVEGSFWLYQKGSNPTGSGSFFQAFRTASAALIINGAGPGSTKAMVSDEELRAQREATDAAMFRAMEAKRAQPDGLDAEALAQVRQMERWLESSGQAGGNP